MNNNEYIRFDWAIKRILRDKANFGVLEGLMTVLLKQPVKIENIIESESNQDSREDKFNRVDVKAKMADGEIVIIEVQLGRERHFLQRILFGVSKAVVEQLQIRQDYENIKKVYSISVLYFDLGSGDDYVYHGKTEFRGVNHPESVLEFTSLEKKLVPGDVKPTPSPEKIYPEYFLLRVNQFNEVAKTPIEEWFAYLKDGVIKPDTTAPGLQEAREKLTYMKMTLQERRAYEDYMVSVHAARDVMETALADAQAEGHAKGHAEGLAEGHAAGLAAGHVEDARRMKVDNMPVELISKYTGLTAEEIAAL
jgi:hypothetical protein